MVHHRLTRGRKKNKQNTQVGNPITKAGGAGAFLRNQRWLRPLVQAGIPINPLLLGGPGALANINLNPLGLNLDPLNVGGNIQALVQDLNNLGACAYSFLWHTYYVHPTTRSPTTITYILKTQASTSPAWGVGMRRTSSTTTTRASSP